MSIERITEIELSLSLDIELLEQEVQRLKEVISEHNRGCRVACAAQRVTGRCRDYMSLGRNCPDCPLDWLIDDESPLK